MSDVVIRAEGLGKKYLIGHQAGRERYTALRDVMARTAKGFVRSLRDMSRGRELVDGDEIEEFWALKDVDFEIRRGDVVGIVGRNGAGKSTLLKVLSRITEPSEGRVEIRGRVASLLEVGTGFHPELTGRENIYLNGAILGMTRAEIRRKFDEIVAFAEVEKFLDTPVKRYSSGMYVRLAFAVAAHLEPEILVVDEVLAVGDAEFQKKCIGKMKDVAGHGRTVLFVSHNVGAITELTDRCVYLESGQVKRIGESREIVELYLRGGDSPQGIVRKNIDSYRRGREQTGSLKIQSVFIYGYGQDEVPNIPIGKSIVIQMNVELFRQVSCHVNLTLYDGQGNAVGVIMSLDQSFMLSGDSGMYSVKIEVEHPCLSPGLYSVDLGIGPSIHATAFDVLLKYPLFCVENTGQVVHWLERPWGSIHYNAIRWKLQVAGDEAA
ncbi:ABC transporter ATP-binding protein [Labrys monachus]|uniref:Lipopolysaccharide transport system ATP-binding protein n=1 Tax=Labrys monachus TaxID=217067 RepID=A0ABU0FJK7_9HYPH|nr:polysaccharide ABC transporter ATP-binding protein [Labrys monachus]MDQ0394796.1 lipopolysaccharide transport system ATP-binding protein [Labrys monachus]